MDDLELRMIPNGRATGSSTRTWYIVALVHHAASITETEVVDHINRLGRAALANKAGFSGVEVHAAPLLCCHL